MRVLSKNIAEHIDKQATIHGWLHKQRKMGGLNFINVRDRSGLVQVLIEDKDEVEKLRGMQIGTVLKVTGKVYKDDRAPGGAEIHEPTIEIDIPVTEVPPIEIDKQIDHKSENHDTLFENRVLNLRNINEGNIFRLRAEINKCIREYLSGNDFIEIQTPKILAGATEGGAEVFKFDYFGQEATLAQSPQFYKQIMVGAFERVYEIGPAFRAEPSMTTRHLSEVTMLDVEMGFIEDENDVFKIAEGIVNTTIEKLYAEHEGLLKSTQSVRPKLTEEFPRYTVAQVHEMFTKATGEDTTDEKDLTPAEERWICDFSKKKHGSEAVFVTELPVAAMKFYHMRSEENPDVALSADLLFRGVEIATIPVREHRYEKLVEQIKAVGIDPDHPGFRYYLMAFKYGLPKHGGFGFGIDRFVQLIVGVKNIKEATLFPRDINRLAP